MDPLALDEDPVPHRLPLLHQPLARALDEVGDDPVHRHAPSLDHDPGLPRGDEDADSPASSTAARRSSRATVIFPIAQSEPTVRITFLPGRCGRPTAVSMRSGTRR